MHLAVCLTVVTLSAAGVAGSQTEKGEVTGNDGNLVRQSIKREVDKNASSYSRKKIEQLKKDLSESRAITTNLSKEIEEMKMEMSNNTFELSDQIAAMDKLTHGFNTHVYFSAGISLGHPKLMKSYAQLVGQTLIVNSHNTRLVFEKILTNAGKAYNKTSGVFTAPFAGFYEFTVSLATTWGKGNYACAFLRKNQGRVAQVLTENAGDTYQGTTIEVVLKLKQGDTVDVVANTHIVGNFKETWTLALGPPTSLFSGKLLSLNK